MATTTISAEHPGLVKLGRAGWLAKGVVYILSGILAFFVVQRAVTRVAPTGNTDEASPTGAIKEVARLSGGRLLLVALGIGLLLYTAWRLATALLPGNTDAKALATRVGYLVSAAIYASLGFSAFSLSRRPATAENGNTKVVGLTERVLKHSLGRWAIGLAGIITIGAGIYRIVQAYKGDVTDELSLSGMSAQRVRLTKVMARVGEVGRGVAIGLIGWFLVRAAVTSNSQEATGLDGVLGRISATGPGQILAGIVAVGFLVYGIMCVETFRNRKLRTP